MMHPRKLLRIAAPFSGTDHRWHTGKARDVVSQDGAAGALAADVLARSPGPPYPQSAGGRSRMSRTLAAGWPTVAGDRSDRRALFLFSPHCETSRRFRCVDRPGVAGCRWWAVCCIACRRMETGVRLIPNALASTVDGSAWQIPPDAQKHLRRTTLLPVMVPVATLYTR